MIKTDIKYILGIMKYNTNRETIKEIVYKKGMSNSKKLELLKDLLK